MTLNEIKAEVKKMDPQLDRRTKAFKAAVCLLSALQVGADSEAVSKFTGYPRKLVDAFTERLISGGVWREGKTCCEWFEEDNGGIAFWLDVCVAQGLMDRKAV